MTDRGIYRDNSQNSVNSRKSQLTPRKKDFGNKSPHFHKKEIRREAPADSPQKRRETESLQTNQSHNPAKSEEDTRTLDLDDTLTAVSDEKSNITSGKLDANDVASNKNDENDDGDDDDDDYDYDYDYAKLLADERNEAQAKDLSQSSGSPEPKVETKADDNTGSRVNEENHVDVCANRDASQDSDLSESKVETEVTEQSEVNEESEDVAKRDLSTRDIDGNRNEITCVESSLLGADSIRNVVETVTEDKERDAPHEREQTEEEITSNSCDSERNGHVVKCDAKSSGKDRADEVAISCSTDVLSIAEQKKNKPEIMNELTKDKVTENDEIAADETQSTNARDKRAAIEHVGQVSARVDNNDNEEKSNAAEKSLKEEKARANEQAQ